jgi:hypothetical protein
LESATAQILRDGARQSAAYGVGALASIGAVATGLYAADKVRDGARLPLNKARNLKLRRVA